MKKIGKAVTINEYDEQISYLEDIMSLLEDIQGLYFKDNIFNDDYKDCKNQISWLEEMQQELINEREELIEKEVKKYDEELKGMIYDFQKERI